MYPELNENDRVTVEQHILAGDEAMSELEACEAKHSAIVDIYNSWPREQPKDDTK